MNGTSFQERGLRLSVAHKLFLVSLIVGGFVAGILGLETITGNPIGVIPFAVGLFGIVFGTVRLGKIGIDSKGQTSTIVEGNWVLYATIVVSMIIAPLDYLFLPVEIPRTIFTQWIGICLSVIGAASMSIQFFWINLKKRNPASAGGEQTNRKEWKSSNSIGQIINKIGLPLFLLGVCLGYSSSIGVAVVLMFALIEVRSQIHKWRNFG
jgi:hypothetical protein